MQGIDILRRISRAGGPSAEPPPGTEKTNLQELLRSAKEAGDVKFSVCRDSVGYFGISVEELIPALEEVQQAETFWKEEGSEADRVLTC